LRRKIFLDLLPPTATLPKLTWAGTTVSFAALPKPISRIGADAPAFVFTVIVALRRPSAVGTNLNPIAQTWPGLRTSLFAQLVPAASTTKSGAPGVKSRIVSGSAPLLRGLRTHTLLSPLA
jgi:hypothetical protein